MHLHCPSLFVKEVRCVARILDSDVGKTFMNMEMLKFLRARASKIIPCVVFNKVIHIIHSNLGMPFYRPPPNGRSRISLSPEMEETRGRMAHGGASWEQNANAGNDSGNWGKNPTIESEFTV